MANVYALIVTHRGRMDSFNHQEPDSFQVQIFSTLQLATQHSLQYPGSEIQQLTVDDVTDALSLYSGW